MATQDYLDFELNIETLPNDQLRVTLANSPVGSVSDRSAESDHACRSDAHHRHP
jgi:hypothetical protein